MTLRRIFDQYAYGDGPRAGCWWDETSSMPKLSRLRGTLSADVAIVGGGFTGLTAALSLAEKGVGVVLLDAQHIGWGASGRNGGFCCLGGGKLSDKALDARFGSEGRLAFRQAEKAAVEQVGTFITEQGLDVDQHSNGETELAHRARDVAGFERAAESVQENYGVTPRLIEGQDLAEAGMGGTPFFGAMTIPIGFGLNPRKYLAGLVEAAGSAGAQLIIQSPVHDISKVSGRYQLTGPGGTVEADQVVIATNGYSSENLPSWLAGRYMPAQSTVLVTRPLSAEEIAAQGWHTDQMAYDTRNLLHYFRLMPDARFLFGMRGGLVTGPGAEARARARTRADFERLFPAWAAVESSYCWSGMVSLARDRLPFVGQIPGSPGLWAALCYHGNGVAMGSYAGRMVAELLLGRSRSDFAAALQRPLSRFPLGRARRSLMPALYAGLMLQDHL